MKKYFLAATALLVVATAADAKCTKKSLNGVWAAGVGAQAAIGTMAGGTYTVTFGGTTVTFTLTSFSKTKCRGIGTGTISGSPYSVTAASEKIPDSDDAPNHLLVTMSAGASSLMLTLQKQ